MIVDENKTSTFALSEINIFRPQFFERAQQLCENAAVLPQRNKSCVVDSSNLTVEIITLKNVRFYFTWLSAFRCFLNDSKSFRVRRSSKFALSTALQADWLQKKLNVYSEHCEVCMHVYKTVTFASLVSVLRLYRYI